MNKQGFLEMTTVLQTEGGVVLADGTVAAQFTQGLVSVAVYMTPDVREFYEGLGERRQNLFQNMIDEYLTFPFCGQVFRQDMVRIDSGSPYYRAVGMVISKEVE
jgi:hypothetical protein